LSPPPGKLRGLPAPYPRFGTFPHSLETSIDPWLTLAIATLAVFIPNYSISRTAPRSPCFLLYERWIIVIAGTPQIPSYPPSFSWTSAFPRKLAALDRYLEPLCGLFAIGPVFSQHTGPLHSARLVRDQWPPFNPNRFAQLSGPGPLPRKPISGLTGVLPFLFGIHPPLSPVLLTSFSRFLPPP